MGRFEDTQPVSSFLYSRRIKIFFPTFLRTKKAKIHPAAELLDNHLALIGLLDGLAALITDFLKARRPISLILILLNLAGQIFASSLTDSP